MIKIDLERNIYLDELFIKRCVKTCVRQFKSIRDIKEGVLCVRRLIGLVRRHLITLEVK